MKSSAKKVELASVDDLFSTEESRADAQREKVVEIPLSELHPFPLCIGTAFLGGKQVIYRCQLYFFRAAFQVSTPPSSDFDTPLPPCRQGHGRKYFFPLR